MNYRALIGLMARAPSGGGGGGSITYVGAMTLAAAASSSSIQVGALPSHNSGDLGLCLVWARSSTPITFSADQSWVKVGSEWSAPLIPTFEPEPVYFCLFKKENLSGSETAPTFTPSATPSSIYVSGVVYRGDSGVIEVSVAGTPDDGVADPLTIPGITTTAIDSLIVAGYVYTDNSGTGVVYAGGSLTWAEDNFQTSTIAADGSIGFGSAVKASTGAMSGDATADLTGSFVADSIVGGVLVALSHP